MNSLLITDFKTYLENRSILFEEIVENRVFSIKEENFLVLNSPDDNRIVLGESMTLALIGSDLDLMDEYNISIFVVLIGNRYYFIDSDNVNFVEQFNEFGQSTGTIPVVKKLQLVENLGENSLQFSDLVFPYVGIHGGYDLCNGSGSYESYVKKAKFLGIKQLGICEDHTLAGSLNFQNACLKEDISPIFGVTFTLYKEDNVPYQIKLYAKTIQGWRNLSTLNYIVNSQGRTSLTLKDIKEYNSDLICILNASIKVEDVEKSFLEIFSKENLFFQLDFLEWSSESRELEWLNNTTNYFTTSKLKPIIILDTYYLNREDASIQEMLWNIGKKGGIKYRSEDRFFKSVDDFLNQSMDLFQEESIDILFEAIDNTIEVFSNIHFKLSFNEKKLPHYELTDIESQYYDNAQELFDDLIEEGIKSKVIAKGLDEKAYRDRVAKELEVIYAGNVRDYFLIVWDILNYCAENNIMVGVGRGSAAGCMVSYLLGIVQIDPIEYDLLFERFLNAGRVLGKEKDQDVIILNEYITIDKGERLVVERDRETLLVNVEDALINDEIISAENIIIDQIKIKSIEEKTIKKSVGGSMPDIDNDIASEYRDQVKRYIEERYGEDYVASIGTYGTFKIRATMKDMIRELGGESEEANYISGILDENDSFESLVSKCTQFDTNPRLRKFAHNNTYQLSHIPIVFKQPKNQSVHAAGIVIFPKEHGEVWKQLPTKTINDIVITEWEGSQIEEAGFLKVDILGLNQLDKFMQIIKLIKENTGEEINLKDIPLDDKGVYEMFQKGYNEDVFQLGGDGLKNYSKELKPETIEDLIATVALYRPGPIEIGAHTKYAEIKNGLAEPEYQFGLEEITKSTHSQIVYQEQIMLIVQALGGFSLVEADDIRKAMGKKLPEVMAKYKSKFIEGAVERGAEEDQAEKIWFDMEGFAGYAFNRCISGEERIYRASQNKSGKSSYWPTIEEMYKIYNDLEYAKSVGKYSLRKKYKRLGYPHSFSLNQEGRLIKNKIKDIRLVGERDLYTVTTESGKTIKVTLNHKFPTSNGEKKLEDIDISKDLLYTNAGFVGYDSSFRFGKEESHNYPKKGEQGFKTKDTDYTKWRTLKEEGVDVCEKCGKEDCRIEMHHKDGNHGNNDKDNVEYLCTSCHKKQDYLLGRNKMGEAGLQTILEKIISIEFYKKDTVYDVEMETPYHTFTVESGIVTSNSHAACYAITGYYSQWLKYHYPLEFWLVSLTNEKDLDKVGRRIAEINDNDAGIKINGPDIGKSGRIYKGDKETKAIYWSLNSIAYVGESAVKEMEQIKEDNGDPYDLEDFLTFVEERKEYKRATKKEGERVLSPIDKRAISNMISCGVFDFVERIVEINERRNILKKYYQMVIPILEGNEAFTEEEIEVWKAKTSEEIYQKCFHWTSDYHWQLEQKRLCGFGDFDLKKIIRENLTMRRFLSNFKTNREINGFELKEGDKKKVLIAGTISKITERRSKNGPFGSIVVSDGVSEIFVTMWNETYASVKEQLKEGSIMICLGNAVYDDWRNQNVFHTDRGSQVEILN